MDATSCELKAGSIEAASQVRSLSPQAGEVNSRGRVNLIKRQRLHSPLVRTQPLSVWAAETMSKYSRLSGSSSDTNET